MSSYASAIAKSAAVSNTRTLYHEQLRKRKPLKTKTLGFARSRVGRRRYPEEVSR